MTATLKPWMTTDLAPDTKKKSLVDQAVKVFEEVFRDDVDNAQALAQSTDREDAVEGSVTIDKILLAALVKKTAPNVPGCEELAEAKVGQISRIMHHATKRVGVDRVAVAQRKAEFLAIRGDEPVWQPESSMNERHDMGNGSTE